MSKRLYVDLDPEIFNALNRRAERRGRSAEAECRDILEKTLTVGRKKSFAEFLLTIPNVDMDKDFERIN